MRRAREDGNDARRGKGANAAPRAYGIALHFLLFIGECGGDAPRTRVAPEGVGGGHGHTKRRPTDKRPRLGEQDRTLPGWTTLPRVSAAMSCPRSVSCCCLPSASGCGGGSLAGIHTAALQRVVVFLCRSRPCPLPCPAPPIPRAEEELVVPHQAPLPRPLLHLDVRARARSLVTANFRGCRVMSLLRPAPLPIVRLILSPYTLPSLLGVMRRGRRCRCRDSPVFSLPVSLFDLVSVMPFSVCTATGPTSCALATSVRLYTAT